MVRIKILDERAEIPQRAHPTDTGYDIKMIDVSHIKGDTIFFKTGIALEPDNGYYFEITPRSSIAKYPLMLANSTGIIDEHYRGEVLVAIRYLGPKLSTELQLKIMGVEGRTIQDIAAIILEHKPKLCQLIYRKRIDCFFTKTNDLDETIRGDGGFGSTDT